MSILNLRFILKWFLLCEFGKLLIRESEFKGKSEIIYQSPE